MESYTTNAKNHKDGSYEQVPSHSLTFRLELTDLSDFYSAILKHKLYKKSLAPSTVDKQPAAPRSGILSTLRRWWSLLLGHFLTSQHYFAIISLGLIVGCFLVIQILLSELSQNFWFMTSVVLAVCLISILTRQIIISSLLKPLINGPLIGRRTYEIEPEGLLMSQDYMQQAWMWQGIIDILETEKAIYLLVDESTSHIFPKNAFASPVHAREFSAFIRERIRLTQERK